MNQTIFENLPRKMNLISDLFSRVVFRDKEACQDLVRIILGEGYEVTEVTSQYDITNLQYRSVVLDILAETAGEEPIHVEFQISDDDDHMRRVRYCNGSIDTHLLKKGKSYKELPDVYHIYITMNDFMKFFARYVTGRKHTAHSILWEMECMSCILIWKFHWAMTVN